MRAVHDHTYMMAFVQTGRYRHDRVAEAGAQLDAPAKVGGGNVHGMRRACAPGPHASSPLAHVGLLRRSVNPLPCTVRPQGGVTALWTAAFNGKADAVKRLAKLGANREAANEVGVKARLGTG